MLCSWKVKEGMVQSTRGYMCGWKVKLCDFPLTRAIPEHFRDKSWWRAIQPMYKVTLLGIHTHSDTERQQQRKTYQQTPEFRASLDTRRCRSTCEQVQSRLSSVVHCPPASDSPATHTASCITHPSCFLVSTDKDYTYRIISNKSQPSKTNPHNVRHNIHCFLCVQSFTSWQNFDN